MASVENSTPNKLMVLWTSGDREVALNMVFMYTLNSKRKGWWENVRLLIWGASTRLLTEDPELQKELRKMREAGVELQACKACSDKYGVSDKLTELGVEVLYVGVPFTDVLKSDWKVITI